MPRGIRGRKSKGNVIVNVIVPKQRSTVDGGWKELDPSDESINPFVSQEPPKSMENIVADRQQQAAHAAEEADAAKESLTQLTANHGIMNAKKRRKLEAQVLAKEKEARRLSLYASLAQHQMKPEHLQMLETTVGTQTGRKGDPTSKRKRPDREADGDEHGGTSTDVDMHAK
jgi:hypothetical protein